MIYYFLNYELHLYIHQLLAVCRKNFFRSHWFFGQSTFCTFMQDFAIARDGFIIMFYIQYFVACLCFFSILKKNFVLRPPSLIIPLFAIDLIWTVCFIMSTRKHLINYTGIFNSINKVVVNKNVIYYAFWVIFGIAPCKAIF